MRVVLLGPPGAGKGTQAQKLSEKLGVPQISTGELFRSNIENGTKLGLEAKRYLEYTLRWRNVPKPSIAAVQGRCISGGLLLCWPCDLIIAADDAQFSDQVVLMGIGGVEYHGHTWELGPRKAKEILFTGRSMTADEVAATGMVNRVVPRDQLDAETRALAEQIAKMPPFALRQAKRAVNQTLDVQGFYAAIQSVFDVHQTGHGNALSVGGWPVLVNLEEMKTNIK